MIKIPIKIGDTVLGGKFKNSPIIVKKISKNEKGDVTINDKPLLRFRIPKKSEIKEEFVNLRNIIKQIINEELKKSSVKNKDKKSPDEDLYDDGDEIPEHKIDDEDDNELNWADYEPDDR